MSLKKKSLEPLFFDLYSYRGDCQDSMMLCRHILVNLPASTLTTQLEISKFRIESWFDGKGSFYLQDLLCILDKFSHYLAEFCLYFLTRDEVSRLGLDLIEISRREFEAKYPIVSLIFRVLESQDHIQSEQASSTYVSQLLGLNENDVNSLLSEAKALDLVTCSGDRYFSEALNIEMRGVRAINQRRFWINEAIKWPALVKEGRSVDVALSRYGHLQITHSV